MLHTQTNSVTNLEQFQAASFKDVHRHWYHFTFKWLKNKEMLQWMCEYRCLCKRSNNGRLWTVVSNLCASLFSICFTTFPRCFALSSAAVWSAEESGLQSTKIVLAKVGCSAPGLSWELPRLSPALIFLSSATFHVGVIRSVWKEWSCDSC